MKNIRRKNRFMMFLFFVVAIIGFGFIVMALWNALLPEILGVKAITFLQALGLLLLSKILFGGFSGGGRWGRGRQWKEGMRQKWGMMSPEEQIKFKAEWERRCSGWRNRNKQDTTVPPAYETGNEG